MEAPRSPPAGAPSEGLRRFTAAGRRIARETLRGPIHHRMLSYSYADLSLQECLTYANRDFRFHDDESFAISEQATAFFYCAWGCDAGALLHATLFVTMT